MLEKAAKKRRCGPPGRWRKGALLGRPVKLARMPLKNAHSKGDRPFCVGPYACASLPGAGEPAVFSFGALRPVLVSPDAELVQRLNKRMSPFGQRIFHLWGNFRIHFSGDQAVPFKLL